MRTKRLLFILCISVLLMAGTAGCGQKGSETAEFYIYYLNKEQTKLVPVAFTRTLYAAGARPVILPFSSAVLSCQVALLSLEI